MAERSFFIPKDSFPFYEERSVSFDYFSGFALSQQQKSIISMHQSIKVTWGLTEILEVSTKSDNSIGVSLSAFNLMLDYQGHSASVESIYQSSKTFTDGGPFLDIAWKSSLEAKRDERLKTSGNLVHFEYEGVTWPLLSSPNFYDFLYISALSQSKFVSQVEIYQAFSDFAYSTRIGKAKKGRSWNCQARSLAIFKGLSYAHSLSELLRLLREFAIDTYREKEDGPLTLF